MTHPDQTSTPSQLPAASHVGRVAFSVADLDEMVAFYTTVIGLTVHSRGTGAATLGTAERPLLELTEEPDVPPRPDSAAGLYHVAFRVPTRAALADALDRVRTEWRLDGASDHHVSEALYLQDPEGNGVELYCDRPREEWPTAEDGTVEMVTDPLDFDDLAARAAGDGSVPAGADVGHVHLEVTSIEDAVDFYVETLGLNVRQRMRGALFVAAGEYHHHVGCNVWRRRSEPASGRGLSWFEVVVPDEAALEAARERFDDAGVETSPLDGASSVDDESPVGETTSSDEVAPGSSSSGFAVTDADGVEIRLRTAEST